MAIRTWFFPDVLDGHTYEVDEQTGIRTPVDVEATRENLRRHMATLYLLDVYTHIAPPTAGDLATFCNKFVEALRIFKSEANEYGSHIDAGKQK